MIAAKLANMKSGERTDLEPGSNSGKVSQDDAAAKLNVGRAAVQQAAIVKNLGSPELQAAVEEGKVSVNADGIAPYSMSKAIRAECTGRTWL